MIEIKTLLDAEKAFKAGRVKAGRETMLKFANMVVHRQDVPVDCKP